ncbi:DUF1993 family protein [Rhizobium giardinii]|uniref:DUF1993 family protein n=1 Tax=Rhizobium giardinii TaxID=56731 RepID=UPI000DDB9619
MSMSNASIPAFESGLTTLSALLDKAEAHAEAKGIDPTVLLNTRLFPDMFAFIRQVQSACDQAKMGCAARRRRPAKVKPKGAREAQSGSRDLPAVRPTKVSLGPSSRQ